ncbi:DUF7507 domain-containing protein [Gryllotalpicola koreensis]|uniref:DUF7507 domain-containing protein n=1 Tax=Gryllotalpicola koreensis TaxID=993086 RepID=UPI0031D7A591
MASAALIASGFFAFAAMSTPPTAQAAAGSPGTPSAPTVVYQEDFENGVGTTPVGLTAYTGATGQKYTADSVWLTGCNGQIRNFNTPSTSQGNCSAEQDAARLNQLAYALGVNADSGTPATNHAVTAYTEGNPGVNATEFQTVSNIPLASSSGRFLTFSVDTAAVNCPPVATAPLYQFAFLDQTGAATNVGGQLNACASGQTINVPANGSAPANTANVGTYTSNGSLLFSGSSLGIRMQNANGSGGGNDAAFDNIRILDVTPQLDKAFTPASVKTGGTSTLTFTVTNTSELAAKNGWSFTDSLPAGLTLASSTFGGTCDATTTGTAGGTSIAITDGALAAGERSCTITAQVTSDTAGTYTNGPANVTETGLNPPGTATVAFSDPELTIVKHAGTPVDVNQDGLTDAGDTIQYTFTVTNTGDQPMTDVSVTDAKAGAVTCPETSLAVGASETCTADDPYTITAADVANGSVDNSATATGTPPSGTPITSTPSTTSTPTTTPAPALTMVKSASPDNEANYTVGQKITYSFTVTNTGNVPLSDVTINEGDFTGTGSLSDPVCPSAELAAGDDETCTATYTLTQADVDAGTLTNTATAIGTPPDGDGDTLTTPPSTVTIPIPDNPAITVVKSASASAATAAGQKITYSFTVTNTGNTTLRNVTVTEGAFSGTGTLSDVTCPEPDLASGDAETCTATYTVTQADIDAGGSISNTATATGTPPNGDTPPVSPPSTSTVTVDQDPSMSVVKSASPSDASSYKVGEQITYSFVVTNTGNVTITDPKVDDAKFSGTGQLSAISCPTSGATLAPGAQEICTATYTVTQADVDAGKLTNTATVTGTTPGGGTTPPSDPSTVTVPGDPHPSLALVKTADVAKVTAVGQVVTYSFEVTNTGNVTITDPAVKEGAFNGHGHLSEVTCPSGRTLTPGQTIDCTATYTVVAADLAGGTLTNTATVTGTAPGGDPLSSDPSTAKVVEDPSAPVVAVNTGGYTIDQQPVWERLLPFGGLSAALLALGAAMVLWMRRKGDQQG